MATVTGVTAVKMDEIDARRYAEITYFLDTMHLRWKNSTDWVSIGSFTGPRGPNGTATVNQALVDAALLPLEPGPWQTLPIDTAKVTAYSTSNYGTPSYRIEQDSLRIAGALEWAEVDRGPTVSAYQYSILTTALPAQYRPAYQTARGLKTQDSNSWELRLHADGMLYIVFHTDGAVMETGHVIYLNQVFPLS